MHTSMTYMVSNKEIFGDDFHLSIILIDIEIYKG